MCMKVSFSEAVTTNMQIGNDFLVFKYPVTFNTTSMQIGNVFLVFKYPVTCKQKISKFS